jgi:hypothetical protein
MKTRVAVGTALLLTLGSAVAGSLMYGQERSGAVSALEVSAVQTTAQEATPEAIAVWKATASSSDYAAPRIPI